MNEVPNAEAPLSLCHYAVIQFAVQLPVFRLSERGLREHQLVVPVNRHSVRLAKSRREARVQRQQLSHFVKREAAVAAAEAVAVD